MSQLHDNISILKWADVTTRDITSSVKYTKEIAPSVDIKTFVIFKNFTFLQPLPRRHPKGQDYSTQSKNNRDELRCTVS